MEPSPLPSHSFEAALSGNPFFPDRFIDGLRLCGGEAPSLIERTYTVCEHFVVPKCSNSSHMIEHGAEHHHILFHSHHL